MGYLYAILAFTGWAFATVLLRGVTLPIPTAVCVGYAIGAAVMLAMSKRADVLTFVAFARKHPWRVVSQAAFYAVTTLSYHWSIQMTTVSNAALTHSMQPLFTCLLFVPLLRRAWPSGWTLLSVLIGFGGLYWALHDKLTGDASLAGILLGIVSAVTYSAGLMQLTFFTKQLEQRSLMGCMMALSCCLMLPFAIAEGGTMPDARGLLMLVGYALTVFALANAFFFASSTRIPDIHLATLGNLEPIAAIAFAALFLSEPLTAASVFGGALVLGSGALLALDQKNAK